MSLCQYMESLEDNYRWELIVVNDGSTDETGKLAEAFAKTRDNLQVFHQSTRWSSNCRFTPAPPPCGYLAFGFALHGTTSREDAGKQSEDGCHISLYERGKISNVPSLRRILACAQPILSIAARGNLSTLTGMVRAYDRNS